MFCVIQEIEIKKSNKNGYSKELKSEYMQILFNGVDHGRYYHSYSEERFERSIKKAYKISIHESYRENGKPKKKQFTLCTVNYYDFACNWFSYYDYCDSKIHIVAEKLKVDVQDIYELVKAKIEPLENKIKEEFSQTEEFKTHEEHERITSLYAINKIKFAEKYECDKDEYDKIYNVFGDLMNSEKLEEIKDQYRARKKYEGRSSYQEYNYSNYNSNYKSSYYDNISSTYNSNDKKILKQFYRALSKEFHPDKNPNSDTTEQMKLLNQLKDEWKV